MEGFITDITERKKAEEEIKSNAAKWQSTFDAISDSVCIINLEGKITQCNAATLSLFDVTENKISKKYCYQLVHGTSEHYPNCPLLRMKNTNRFESMIFKKGNRWLEVSVDPIFDTNKELIGAVHVVSDITERKLAEEKLVKYADRLQILHKMDKSILAAKSPEKIASEVIKEMKKFFSYKHAAVVEYDATNNTFARISSTPSSSNYKLTHIPVPVSHYEMIDIERLKKGRVQIIKDLRRLNTKAERIIELRNEGIYSMIILPLLAEKKLMGILSLAAGSMEVFAPDKIEIATEIANQLAVSIRQWKLREEIVRYTEELEERVIERTAQLEHSNRELREFAQIVSHDLKAPLRAISQLSYWVSKDYADKIDEEGQKQLEMLTGRVKRMDKLIEGILQYSRAGKQREKEVPVNLHTLVEETIILLDPPSHIKISIENQLPEYTGDPTRFGQLFQNLIDNAIKFMDKPQGLIKIGCRKGLGSWQFFISDNGPGIEEKYFERIFQIFQRLVSRDVHEGAGVGLSLAKRIVQIYGGDIWLTSKPGEGTSFYFTLPFTYVKTKMEENSYER